MLEERSMSALRIKNQRDGGQLAQSEIRSDFKMDGGKRDSDCNCEDKEFDKADEICWSEKN